MKKIITTLSLCIVLTITICAQTLPPTPTQTALQQALQTIQAQQASYPVPVSSQTIWVGEINLSFNMPWVTYEVPTYLAGSHYWGGFFQGPPPEHVPPHQAPDYGGFVKLINVKHCSLRFTITNWQASDANITVTLGNSSPQTVNNGTSEIIFPDIDLSQKYLQFTILVNGQYPFYTSSGIMSRPYPFFPSPLQLESHTVANGILTLPALPVSLVYAPVADAHHINENQVSFTEALGQTVTASFSNSQSTQTTQLSPLDQIAGDMKAVGSVFAIDPDTKSIGTALTSVAGVLPGLFGSSQISTTNGTSTTQTSSGSDLNSLTIETDAKTTLGGPGQDDVAVYLQNAKFLWSVLDGKVTVSYLGCDKECNATMYLLKRSRDSLNKLPLGTKDLKFGLDTTNINSLLRLDPFNGPDGSHTILDPHRFSLFATPDGITQFGITATQSFTLQHQITSLDMNAKMTTTTQVTVDKAGWLSFLGIGPSDDQTIQSSITQSSSLANSATQTITQKFTFNGDGKTDNYSCEVYYDNIFNTYAFREPLPTESDQILTGTIVDPVSGNAVPEAKLTIFTGDKILFALSADRFGNFKAVIPHQFKNLSVKTNTMILAIKTPLKSTAKLQLKAKKEDI